MMTTIVQEVAEEAGRWKPWSLTRRIITMTMMIETNIEIGGTLGPGREALLHVAAGLHAPSLPHAATAMRRATLKMTITNMKTADAPSLVAGPRPVGTIFTTISGSLMKVREGLEGGTRAVLTTSPLKGSIPGLVLILDPNEVLLSAPHGMERFRMSAGPEQKDLKGDPIIDSKERMTKSTTHAARTLTAQPAALAASPVQAGSSRPCSMIKGGLIP
mmetsp:Transcript_19527/g.25749  ORF Transcript_19527/g.25749 Transcript_19527/m.25749 type:complete len:217 (+) Transcript_19527:678-1328(+)